MPLHEDDEVGHDHFGRNKSLVISEVISVLVNMFVNHFVMGRMGIVMLGFTPPLLPSSPCT